MNLCVSTPLLDASAALAPGRPAPTIVDAHSEHVVNPNLTDVDAALRAFFTESPPWLEKLLQVRNAIVSRLGFETGPKGTFELPERFEVGDNIGTFEVLARSDDEIVMGGDDQRFALEISIWLPAGEQRLQLTTTAHHKDAIGQAYLRLVRKPHGWIAPMLTRRMASGA